MTGKAERTGAIHVARGGAYTLLVEGEQALMLLHGKIYGGQ